MSTLFIILAACCWGTVTIFIKELSALGFSNMQIAFVRVTTAAIFYCIITLIKNPGLFRIKLKDIWIFLGTGIGSVFFMNLTYFYAMNNGQASVATVLLYTSPVWIMVLSALLFKEKVTGRKILALALTFSGCILVSGIIGQSYRIPIKIILIGLSSGIAYGLYSIFGRYGSNRKYNSMTITTYTFIVCAAFTFPFVDKAPVFRAFRTNPVSIILSIGIGIVPTVLAYLFYTLGLQGMENGKAGVIVTLDMVIGEIIGMTIYNEPHNIMKIIGIILVLLATVIFNISPKKKQIEKAS